MGNRAERRAAARGKGGQQRYERWTFRGADCRRAELAPFVFKATAYVMRGETLTEHYALVADWKSAKIRAERLAQEALDGQCNGCDRTEQVTDAGAR